MDLVKPKNYFTVIGEKNIFIHFVSELAEPEMSQDSIPWQKPN